MAVAAQIPIVEPSTEKMLAEEAGLRYMRDNVPGYSRRMLDGDFVYVDASGKRVRDAKVLKRAAALVIPPAWTDVWISPSPVGHIQATGRDQKGRKQYRYHAEYRALRDNCKFCRLVEFAEALPIIRRQMKRALNKSPLSRTKVLALTLSLLEETGIRIGNEEYVKQNGSFGLTTLTKRHVVVRGELMRFEFKAKSGKMHNVEMRDRRLARVVKQCSNLPGQALFQYKTADGVLEQVSSSDVNDLLREMTGQEFSAKDFRTWLGTTLATRFFKEAGPQETARARKRTEVEVVTRVAQALNNRPATCRKYYIHPGVLEPYIDGSFFNIIRRRRGKKKWRGLEDDEKDALKLCLNFIEHSSVS